MVVCVVLEAGMFVAGVIMMLGHCVIVMSMLRAWHLLVLTAHGTQHGSRHRAPDRQQDREQHKKPDANSFHSQSA